MVICYDREREGLGMVVYYACEGKAYRFVDVQIIDGFLYGKCLFSKGWRKNPAKYAWMCGNTLQFEDEPHMKEAMPIAEWQYWSNDFERMG